MYYANNTSMYYVLLWYIIARTPAWWHGANVWNHRIEVMVAVSWFGCLHFDANLAFCRKILIVCEGKLKLNCMYLQFCKDIFVCMKGGCGVCSIYTSQWINILASVGPHIGGGGGKGGLGPRGERLSDPISLLSATRSSDSSRYKFQTVNHTTLHFKVYLSFPLP